MATPNPLENTQPTTPPPVSSKTYHIAGILTTVYGLSELPTSCDHLSCLWLLHPRLQTSATMSPIASTIIQAWNGRRSSNSSSSSQSPTRGLIAISFDQRNHGSRLVEPMANESWRAGNPRHAQDMYGIFHGTAVDTSLLMDGLGSYVFLEKGGISVKKHFVLGVSLGGHAAWQVLLKEPRVEAAVVVIGCPDYIRVMSDRARKSKLESYMATNGKDFIGGKDFPAALVASVRKWDPRGLLFGGGEIDADPSLAEQSRLRALLDPRLKGKSVLVCSGGADKLVPYRCAAPFMEFLKRACKGWYIDGNVYVEDNVYEGIGHAFSPEMAKDATRFICDLMEEKDLRKAAKI